jgi:hypothetical protein
MGAGKFVHEGERLCYDAARHAPPLAIMIPQWARRSYWATRFLAQCYRESVVVRGPFAGLRLPSRAFCGPVLAKRAGIYERELVPWIERLLTARPALIVDVGAAEGYYAVGLARALPGSRVLAFEGEAEARALLSECIALNGSLGNITVAGWCDAPALEASLHGAAGAWVLIDAEGAEREILDPAVVPSLAQATIIVELHDFIVPGIRTLLEGRFAVTHHIDATPALPRTAEDFPEPLTSLQKFCYGKHIANALSDRGVANMEWLLLTPRQA